MSHELSSYQLLNVGDMICMKTLQASIFFPIPLPHCCADYKKGKPKPEIKADHQPQKHCYQASAIHHHYNGMSTCDVTKTVLSSIINSLSS